MTSYTKSLKEGPRPNSIAHDSNIPMPRWGREYQHIATLIRRMNSFDALAIGNGFELRYYATPDTGYPYYAMYWNGQLWGIAHIRCEHLDVDQFKRSLRTVQPLVAAFITGLCERIGVLVSTLQIIPDGAYTADDVVTPHYAKHMF